MSTKHTQAQRIAAEVTQTRGDGHNGRSRVPMLAYRLQADDLPEGSLTAKIHAVTSQGVEVPTTLAHLEGFTKPLTLDAEDMNTLMRMTGSPFAADWIGCTVEVRSVRCEGQYVLRLSVPGAPGAPAARLATPKPRRHRLRSAAGFVLILILALLAVYLAEEGTVLWTVLQDMLSSIER